MAFIGFYLATVCKELNVSGFSATAALNSCRSGRKRN